MEIIYIDHVEVIKCDFECKQTAQMESISICCRCGFCYWSSANKFFSLLVYCMSFCRNNNGNENHTATTTAATKQKEKQQQLNK